MNHSRSESSLIDGLESSLVALKDMSKGGCLCSLSWWKHGGRLTDMNPWFLLLVILSALSSFSAARDTITPTQPLADNETLISSNDYFALGFFTPDNSSNRYLGLWYNQVSIRTILWVANRASPVINSTATLSITANGSLLVIDQTSSQVVWATKATGVTSSVSQLLNTGNLVVKQDGENSEGYAWQSFNFPTDTLLPGMKLGVDRTTGLNYSLIAWRSDFDPAPGGYYLWMDANGNGYPEMYLNDRSGKIWRSGPWDGYQFSGMQLSGVENWSFSNSQEEETLSYNATDWYTFYRLVVDKTGMLQQLMWDDGMDVWRLLWSVPSNQCDKVSICGPNTICNPNATTSCACMSGFIPSMHQEGCTRITALDCRSRTDVFVTLGGAMLPDSMNAKVNMESSRGLEYCQYECLKNCSCVAYARAPWERVGCVFWTTDLFDLKLYDGAGHNLYVRMAAEQEDPESHRKKTIVAVCVSLLFAGILFLTLLRCFLWKRKKRMTLDNSNCFKDGPNAAEENDLDLPLFDFFTISAATDYFSAGRKLGEGGFGPVYKGKLGDDQEIAIKRLAKTSQQGNDEFKNEVLLIAKLQHRNLVRLLGCCIHRDERMLIYDYMPNGSLDAFLFDKVKSRLLDWKTRHQIIIGITRGLLYLHHDSRVRVIHRDLKASNILLDKEMNPKISDFGMARICGGDITDFNTRKVVGTYGYMSPEYAMEGIFSVKSDVFSFGVLVLEIISGKRNRGKYALPQHINLVAHAWSLWNENMTLQIVDLSIAHSFPAPEVLKFVRIGLLCVQEEPNDRPLMSSVIQMFGSDVASLPEPKKPGFVTGLCPLQGDPSARRKQQQVVSNELTVSMLEGR